MRVRRPAVAGSFYPEDPRELEEMIAGLLPRPAAREPRKVVALMAPHAGYIYSGKVAGLTYAEVDVPSRVILLGPNHTGLGAALSLWDRGQWEMPGSVTEVDADLCDSLLRHCPIVVPDRAAHLREHGLEVQIPFLRARQTSFRITPVVVGTSRLEDLRTLGRGLAAAVKDAREGVLLVISSDMTHYEPAAIAAVKDRRALDAMERLDPEGLHRVVREEGISMCGYAPAVSGLFAARELGATSGRLVDYSHSGVVTGDSDSVVGYAGAVFS